MAYDGTNLPQSCSSSSIKACPSGFKCSCSGSFFFSSLFFSSLLFSSLLFSSLLFSSLLFSSLLFSYLLFSSLLNLNLNLFLLLSSLIFFSPFILTLFLGEVTKNGEGKCVKYIDTFCPSLFGKYVSCLTKNDCFFDENTLGLSFHFFSFLFFLFIYFSSLSYPSFIIVNNPQMNNSDFIQPLNRFSCASQCQFYYNKFVKCQNQGLFSFLSFLFFSFLFFSFLFFSFLFFSFLFFSFLFFSFLFFSFLSFPFRSFPFLFNLFILLFFSP